MIYLRKRQDVIGFKQGKLTVTGIAPTPTHIKNPNTLYVYCDCECGNKNVIKRFGNIQSKMIYSCGCKYHKVGKRYKTNIYEEHEDYYVGYDFKGEKFYISKEDYPKVKELTWFVNVIKDYEVVNAANNLKLHRFIMEINDKQQEVDHINHLRNDNRRNNLRIVNRFFNSANKGLQKTNTSGVTGVSASKNNKWHATIGINYKTIHLGTFDNFDDAVKARKEAEEKYFGEYSYDNSQRIAQQHSFKQS